MVLTVTADTAGTTGDIVPILAPLMGALSGLADATEVLAGSGMAMANSQAMAELSDEAKLVGDDWDEPVHAAHSNAGILRFASTDALRQFTRLFASQPVPVYAHLAVARAGLESAAHSYWAAASRIGPVARVQRFQAIRLRNGLEMKRSPIPEFKEQGTRVNAQIREQCQQRGWQVIANETRIEVGDQQLPGAGALVRELVAEGSDAPALQRLGATAWWFQSGGSHAVNYALIESIEAYEQAPSFGPQLASVFTSSRSVALQALILGLGYRSMIEEHRRLFGWSNDSWSAAVQLFVREHQRVTTSAATSS
jgi:hypothetical protein